MELVARSQDKNSLDVEFVGERKTVLYLLKEQLLEDDKVASANVVADHPVIGNPRLTINTSSGKPTTALKRAAKECRNRLDALEDAFLDEL